MSIVLLKYFASSSKPKWHYIDNFAPTPSIKYYLKWVFFYKKNVIGAIKSSSSSQADGNINACIHLGCCVSSIRLRPIVPGLQTQQPRFLQNGLLLSSYMSLLSSYVLYFFQLFFVFCFTVKRCASQFLFKVFLFLERSVQSSDFRGSPEKTRVSDKSPTDTE